eukprot:CAMPEP_0184399990 /NCGR_PEP_ID=MMETSP0007-20130409/72747_1 /TAXON_ID=97485 /ORGANISM="Prymnesium parvum, Strain Texoma1" /LENGTH=81 /DNA_ID=CAMNT_0026754679 /DNA_START=93 /DNA_END=335 /DNA_ORIENTATION=-
MNTQKAAYAWVNGRYHSLANFISSFDLASQSLRLLVNPAFSVLCDTNSSVKVIMNVGYLVDASDSACFKEVTPSLPSPRTQ